LFYDLTDRGTFDHLSFWLNEIQDHAEEDTIVMLVGNKCDLVKENPDERQVTTKEAEEFAKSCGTMYSETSAKTGENVKEAFESLLESKRI
jgi:small GTP-binding protein